MQLMSPMMPILNPGKPWYTVAILAQDLFVLFRVPFMKSAKRRKVFPTPVSHTDPFVAQEVRTAGYELYQHLVSLYALGKLSAKDLCVASHYAASAAVPGGDFESLAMDPSSQSGKFQAHLDRVLPSVGPLVWFRFHFTGGLATMLPRRLDLYPCDHRTRPWPGKLWMHLV